MEGRTLECKDILKEGHKKERKGGRMERGRIDSRSNRRKDRWKERHKSGRMIGGIIQERNQRWMSEH